MHKPNTAPTGSNLLEYIDKLIPENGHLEFDFRDPKQYQFALSQMRKYFDTERYPGKLKAMEMQKRHQEKNGFVSALSTGQDGFQNMFAITGLGHTPAGQITIASNGFGTITGGYASLSLLLFVKDLDTNTIVTHGTSNELAGTLLPVSTLVGGLPQPNLNVEAYLQYSAVPHTGNPLNGIVKLGAYNAVDPVLSQPIAWCTQPWVPNAINIGLGRQWTDPQLGVNFDYAWSESPTNNPIGKIPFVGSVTFSQAIQPLQPNQNFLLQIYVANDTSGGTVTLNPTNLANVFTNFQIDPTNPNKLNWNLPAGHSVSDPGNPITFGGIPWPSDMLGYFYCQIIVTLADGSFGSATVQSQTTPDVDPLDGTLGILPISFVWHCLSLGTRIAMADGTIKEIEHVVAGDRIKTGVSGETRKVAFTTFGKHDGVAVKIKTVGGDEIVSSANHVFMTAHLPKPAAELHIGDAVMTAKGAQIIACLELIPNYKGMMCNLALENTGARGAESFAMSTFVANDFVVGDANSQRAHRIHRKNDIGWVKSRVPAYLHRDVDSFFEDKARNLKTISKG